VPSLSVRVPWLNLLVFSSKDLILFSATQQQQPSFGGYDVFKLNQVSVLKNFFFVVNDGSET
jgi:hypothetical protein